ncbi:P2X purinoceptor 7 [Cheilinus undulatus]|uniref:P2X purinoceptor 7 n=1 Tax=Cheilinus undulatus TaxID=241271 RepID=UPI001BD60075|nr:P2X purinoceptor 7 [Cheilinus undulatus]
MAERAEGLRRARKEETEKLLQDIPVEKMRELALALFDRQPGLVLDTLKTHEMWRGYHGSFSRPVTWCVCGNCRDMATVLEKKFCGQEPDRCISTLPSFSLYCLDAVVLRIHRSYREDTLALGDTEEPGEDNREFCHAAFRHFLLWQYGAVEREQQVIIPSCCVWKINDMWPDPFGQYPRYVPKH